MTELLNTKKNGATEEKSSKWPKRHGNGGSNLVETTPEFRAFVAKKLVSSLHSQIEFVKKVSDEKSMSNCNEEDATTSTNSVWGFRLFSNSNPTGTFHEREPPTVPQRCRRRGRLISSSSSSDDDSNDERYAPVDVPAASSAASERPDTNEPTEHSFDNQPTHINGDATELEGQPKRKKLKLLNNDKSVLIRDGGTTTEISSNTSVKESKKKVKSKNIEHLSTGVIQASVTVLRRDSENSKSKKNKKTSEEMDKSVTKDCSELFTECSDNTEGNDFKRKKKKTSLDELIMNDNQEAITESTCNIEDNVSKIKNKKKKKSVDIDNFVMDDKRESVIQLNCESEEMDDKRKKKKKSKTDDN